MTEGRLGFTRFIDNNNYVKYKYVNKLSLYTNLDSCKYGS